VNGSGPNAVSAQARGLARDFIRRADVDTTRHMGQLKKILRPGLALDDGTVTEAARAWEAAPFGFRLAFTNELQEEGGLVWEVAVQGAPRSEITWAGDPEPSIVFRVTCLLATSTGTKLKTVFPVSVGLHALGRRMERGGKPQDDRLLQDLRVLLPWVSPPVEAVGRDVRISAQEGEWCGRIVNGSFIGAPLSPRPVLAIRTWI
jgi:hypothetical protein